MAQTWQQVVEAQADANGLCEATYTIPAHRPVTLTRMACSGDSLVLPVGAQSGQRYRGPWNGEGTLLYTQDFSGSASLPTGFTAHGPSPVFSRVGIATPPAANTPPGYTYAGRVTAVATYEDYIIRMTKANVAALVGKTITRVKAWVLPDANVTDPATTVRAQGAVSGTGVVTSASAAGRTSGGAQVRASWEEVTMQPNQAGDWEWRTLRGGPQPGSLAINVAGIRVYGNEPSDAYAVNDVVFWKGYLWLCLSAGTTAEPGTSAAWSQVPGVASSSGNPELRVYRNGTLLDASGNANTDVSDSMEVECNPGDLLRAVWQNCSPGARMRLAFDGAVSE